jgi:hypothetical protein
LYLETGNFGLHVRRGHIAIQVGIAPDCIFLLIVVIARKAVVLEALAEQLKRRLDGLLRNCQRTCVFTTEGSTSSLCSCAGAAGVDF